MFQLLVNKIRNRVGETLVEALVAILVSSLAILMLATVISTSRNIIVSSKQALETYCVEETALASRSATSTSGDKVNVTMSFSGTTWSSSSVTISNVPSYEAHVGSKPIISYGVS